MRDSEVSATTIEAPAAATSAVVPAAPAPQRPLLIGNDRVHPLQQMEQIHRVTRALAWLLAVALAGWAGWAWFAHGRVILPALVIAVAAGYAALRSTLALREWPSCTR